MSHKQSVRAKRLNAMGKDTYLPIAAPDSHSMTDAMKRELAQWALTSLTQQRFSSATHNVIQPPDEVVNNPNVVSSLVVPKDGSKSLLIQYPLKSTTSSSSSSSSSKDEEPTTPMPLTAPPTSPDVKAQLAQQLDYIDALSDGLIRHPIFDHLVIRDTSNTKAKTETSN